MGAADELIATVPAASPSLEKARQTCPVLAIGCGAPLKSVGWYHCQQLCEVDWDTEDQGIDGCGHGQPRPCPSADLRAIVSSSWAAGGAFAEGGDEHERAGRSFRRVAELSGVAFHASVADFVTARGGSKDQKLLTVIACRTTDCPQRFREAIELAGATHIFLEKPGAPTLGELEEMQRFAKERGVPVYMGFNKNVAAYVQRALDYVNDVSGSGGEAAPLVTFVHNNTFTRETLAGCFEQNSEGMLKNMAVHEIALLVTYFGVSVDTIANVSVDRDFSECLSLGGRTDFAKVGFTITTTDSRRARVRADRCGGVLALATVESNEGDEVFRAVSPDDALQTRVDRGLERWPQTTPYLFANSDDYATMKERICAHIASGSPGDPEGIATLAIAIQTMRVCEHLTEVLKRELMPSLQ